MARGLAGVVDSRALTVVVNVGDDDMRYGVHVAADLDTMLYTLGSIEGPQGWGIDGDGFTIMDHLAKLGVDTAFRLGDRDLANCLFRTEALAAGEPLSAVTRALSAALGVPPSILPATDDRLRTKVRIATGAWLDFQDYFVVRGHRDEVVALRYEGAESAVPASGVLEAIDDAAVVVIAPSNPPLSIWPILAVSGVREALAVHDRVVAISPLFKGKALKGPADRVMASLGLPQGNEGILAAYPGLLTDLVVDTGDSEDAVSLAERGVSVHVADTRIADAAAGHQFADWLLDTVIQE